MNCLQIRYVFLPLLIIALLTKHFTSFFFMYHIPIDYVPDRPYYSRKGRTYYKKHPRFPRKYTISDIEQARKFWENNPPAPIYLQNWYNCFELDSSDQRIQVRKKFRDIEFMNDASFEFELPSHNPIDFLFLIGIKTADGIDFFCIHVDPSFSEPKMTIKILNQEKQWFCVLWVPRVFQIFESFETTRPIMVWFPTSLDPLYVDSRYEQYPLTFLSQSKNYSFTIYNP